MERKGDWCKNEKQVMLHKEHSNDKKRPSRTAVWSTSHQWLVDLTFTIAALVTNIATNVSTDH